MIKIYPQLINEESLKNWTYADCENYISAENDKLFAPSAKETDLIKEKGLTLDDTRYLLKYFGTYSNVLNQPNEELIKILTNHYKFKLDYLEYMNYVDDSTFDNALSSLFNVKVSAATPPAAYIDNYVIIPTFPYYAYPNDPVHKDAGTQNYYTYRYQSEKAVELYRAIYGSGTTPTFTNIWGAYSSYSNGAHEGIDMVGGAGSTIKYPVNGSGTVKKPRSAILVVQKTSASKSFFFLHMTNRTTSSTVNTGDSLGKEGNIGNGDGGAHLHFAMEDGVTTSTHSATNNHDLDSFNPYKYNVY